MSFITTDYKIITKALATRLHKVIPVIIDSDQVVYIKKRYIGQRVRIIYDLLIHANESDLDA